MVDVTDVPDVESGDEVVLFRRQFFPISTPFAERLIRRFRAQPGRYRRDGIVDRE
jgi:hypothetical protein